MAKAEVAVTNTNSIVDEIMRRHDMIARRAFELFQSHMDSFSAELEDWLMAEREIAMQPDVSLRRADGRFEIDAALPDVDPKKLEVKVTPEDVLISATSYFSAIHLPEPIDPEAVQAHFNKGRLHLIAKIARTEPERIEARV